MFAEGNYKHSHSQQEHTDSSINPKHVKQTFAQEIEEKYFQIPTSSNEPENKHLRRGSLRAFQVCFKITSQFVVYYVRIIRINRKLIFVYDFCGIILEHC